MSKTIQDIEKLGKEEEQQWLNSLEAKANFDKFIQELESNKFNRDTLRFVQNENIIKEAVTKKMIEEDEAEKKAKKHALEDNQPVFIAPNKILDDSRLIALAKALRQNQNVKTLNIRGIGLTKDSAEAFIETLHHNKTLTEINFSNSFNNPRLGDWAGYRLAEAIQNNETLTRVYLNNNHFGEIALQRFGDLLTTNQRLIRLGLGGHHFTKVSFEALIEGIRRNQTFLELALSNSGLTNQAGKMLLEVLRHNFRLEALHLNDNPMDRQIQKEIQERIVQNQRRSTQYEILKILLELVVALTTGRASLEYYKELHKVLRKQGLIWQTYSSDNKNKTEFENIKNLSEKINGICGTSPTLTRGSRTLNVEADILPLVHQFSSPEMITIFVRKNQITLLECLFQQARKLLEEQFKGLKLLHFAIEEGHLGMVSRLLRFGCSPESKNEQGQTPFHVAVQSGNLECAQQLLNTVAMDKLAKELEIPDQLGRTPLLLTAIHGQKAMLEWILRYRANLNHQDSEGNSLLHLAIRHRRISILEVLFAPGQSQRINLELTDSRGRTALHLASELAYVLGIRSLCSQQANLEAIDGEGLRPLHRAILSTEKEALEATEALLYCGANPSSHTEAGLDALSLAQRADRTFIHGRLQGFMKSHEEGINPHRIRNLVFQGGSVKGVAYLGALDALIAHNVRLEGIERVGGTSAGAITAVLLGLGYDLSTLKNMLEALDFKHFLDENSASLLAFKKRVEEGGIINWLGAGYSLPGLLSTLNRSLGLCSGNNFRAWIEKAIYDRTGIHNATFAELSRYREGGNPKRLKEIYLIGTDLTTGKAKIFSSEETPNDIVSDAVRISMSIPFLFTPHGRYVKDSHGNRIREGMSLYVDGGVSDNYPIWLFDNSRYIGQFGEAISEQFRIREVNRETLGFRLVNLNVKQEYEDAQMSIPEKNTLDGLFSLFAAVGRCFSKKQESDHARQKEDRDRTIYIETLNVSMLDFNLSGEMKRSLSYAGYRAADEYCRRAIQFDQPVSFPPAVMGSLFSALLSPIQMRRDGGIQSKNLRFNPFVIPEFIYQFYLTLSTPSIAQKAFLERLGISLNTKDRSGNTALHLTAVRAEPGSFECAKRLLEAGISNNVINLEGNTALDLVAKQIATVKASDEQVRIVLFLVEMGNTRVQLQNLPCIQAIIQPVIDTARNEALKKAWATLQQISATPLSPTPPIPSPTSLISPLLTPRLLVGKLRAETVYFSQIPNNGVDILLRTGSCGFISLGTTREQVQKVLKANLDNPALQKRVGEQIYNDYKVAHDALRLSNDYMARLTKIINAYSASQDERNELIKRFKEGTGLKEANEKELIEHYTPLNDGADKIKLLQEAGKKLKEAEEELHIFLASKGLVEDYLTRNLEGEWLGAQLALAWAIVSNRTLRIWKHQEARANSTDILLFPGLSHEEVSDSAPIDIIHTWNGTHYERLRREAAPHSAPIIFSAVAPITTVIPLTDPGNAMRR